MEGKKPAGGKGKNQRGHNTKMEEIHVSKMGSGTLIEIKLMGER